MDTCRHCGTPVSYSTGTVRAHFAPCGAVCSLGCDNAQVSSPEAKVRNEGKVHYSASYPRTRVECPICNPSDGAVR